MVDIELKSTPTDPAWLTPDDQGKGHFHYRIGTRSHKWRPPTDVYETDTAIIVRVEIAGMRDSEFSISLDNRILTIQGLRTDRDERRAFHQMEIRYGEFSTTLELHWAIDSKSIAAEYNDGVLRLVLPKAVPHKIEIGK